MPAEHRPDPAVEAVLGIPLPDRDERRDPPLAVRLPTGMRAQVKAKARQRGLTPNGLAVRAIQRELEDPSPNPKERPDHGRTP